MAAFGTNMQTLLDLTMAEANFTTFIAIVDDTIADFKVNGLTHDHLSARRDDLLGKLKIVQSTKEGFERYGRII